MTQVVSVGAHTHATRRIPARRCAPRRTIRFVIGSDGQSELLTDLRKTLYGNRSGIPFTPQGQRQVQEATILLFARHDQAHEHRMLQGSRKRLMAAVGFSHRSEEHTSEL